MNGNFYQQQYNLHPPIPSYQQQSCQDRAFQQNNMDQLVAEGNFHLANHQQQPNYDFVNIQQPNFNLANRTHQQRQQSNPVLYELQYVDRMITEAENTSEVCQKQLEYIQFQYNQIQGDPDPVLVERYNSIIRQKLVYQSQKDQMVARKAYLLSLMDNSMVQMTDKQIPLLQSHSHLLTPPLTPQSPDISGQYTSDEISSSKLISQNSQAPDNSMIPINPMVTKIETKLRPPSVLKTSKDNKLNSKKLEVIDLTTDDDEEDEDTKKKVLLQEKVENDISKFGCSTINDEEESVDSAYHSLPSDVSGRVDQLAEEYCEKNFLEHLKPVEKLPDMMEILSDEIDYGCPKFKKIVVRETNKLKEPTTTDSVHKNGVKKEEEDEGDACDLLVVDEGIDNQTSVTQEDDPTTGDITETSDDNLQVELYEEAGDPIPGHNKLPSKVITNCHLQKSSKPTTNENSSLRRREGEISQDRVTKRIRESPSLTGREDTASCNLVSATSASTDEETSYSSDSSLGLPEVVGFKSTYTSKKNPAQSESISSSGDSRLKRKKSVSHTKHSLCNNMETPSMTSETLIKQLQKPISYSTKHPEKVKPKNKANSSVPLYEPTLSSLFEKKADVVAVDKKTTSTSKNHKSAYGDDNITSTFSLDEEDDPVRLFNKRKELGSKDRRGKDSSLKTPSRSHDKDTRMCRKTIALAAKLKVNKSNGQRISYKPSSKPTSSEEKRNTFEKPPKNYHNKKTDDHYVANIKDSFPPRSARSSSNDLPTSKEVSRIKASSVTKKMSDDQRMYLADIILQKRRSKKMRSSKKSRTTIPKKKQNVSIPTSSVVTPSLSFGCYKLGGSSNFTPSTNTPSMKNKSTVRKGVPPGQSTKTSRSVCSDDIGGKLKELPNEFNRNYSTVFRNIDK